jgi:hypothetical protein
LEEGEDGMNIKHPASFVMFLMLFVGLVIGPSFSAAASTDTLQFEDQRLSPTEQENGGSSPGGGSGSTDDPGSVESGQKDNPIGDIFNRVGDFFDDAGEAVVDAWDYTTDKISDGWDYTVDKVSDGWDYTTEKVSDGWDYTTGLATDAWNGVENWWNDLPPWVQDSIKTAGGIAAAGAVIAGLVAAGVIAAPIGIVAGAGALIGGGVYALLTAGTDNYSFLGSLLATGAGALSLGAGQAFLGTAVLTGARNLFSIGFGQQLVIETGYSFLTGKAFNLRDALIESTSTGVTALLTLGLGARVANASKLGKWGWTGFGALTTGIFGSGVEYFTEGSTSWETFGINVVAGGILTRYAAPLVHKIGEKMSATFAHAGFVDTVTMGVETVEKGVSKGFTDGTKWAWEKTKSGYNKAKDAFSSLKGKLGW